MLRVCFILFYFTFTVSEAFDPYILNTTPEGVYYKQDNTAWLPLILYSHGATVAECGGTKNESYAVLNKGKFPERIVRAQFPSKICKKGCRLPLWCKNDAMCKTCCNYCKGTNFTRLIKLTNCTVVENLSHDWKNHNIYWTCQKPSPEGQVTLNRANTEGTEVKEEVLLTIEKYRISNMTIDPYAGYLFWLKCPLKGNTIYVERFDVNKLTRTPVYNLSVSEAATGLSIVIDIPKEKLYVVGIDNWLVSMNYDGSSPNTEDPSRVPPSHVKVLKDSSIKLCSPQLQTNVENITPNTYTNVFSIINSNLDNIYNQTTLTPDVTKPDITELKNVTSDLNTFGNTNSGSNESILAVKSATAATVSTKLTPEREDKHISNPATGITVLTKLPTDVKEEPTSKSSTDETTTVSVKLIPDESITNSSTGTTVYIKIPSDGIKDTISNSATVSTKSPSDNNKENVNNSATGGTVSTKSPSDINEENVNNSATVATVSTKSPSDINEENVNNSATGGTVSTKSPSDINEGNVNNSATIATVSTKSPSNINEEIVNNSSTVAAVSTKSPSDINEENVNNSATVARVSTESPSNINEEIVNNSSTVATVSTKSSSDINEEIVNNSSTVATVSTKLPFNVKDGPKLNSATEQDSSSFGLVTYVLAVCALVTSLLVYVFKKKVTKGFLRVSSTSDICLDEL